MLKMLLDPPADSVGAAVKLFHVRLDVENQCAVQNIYFREVQPVHFDSLDSDHRQPDMVRAVGILMAKTPCS